MQKKHDQLGAVVKAARNRNQITMETLATKLDTTERHLYRIENERKRPSFQLLGKLIRELNIAADTIFYPDMEIQDAKRDHLTHMLYRCNDQSLAVIEATVKALLENQTSQ